MKSRVFFITALCFAFFILSSAESPAANDDSVPAASYSSQSLYGKAIAEFNAGQFQEALSNLLEFNKQKLDPVTKEAVLRLIADCYYEIGRKGNNRELLTAVDSYKIVLQKYPNAADRNAEAMYRLADTYLHLKFYYEAKREFQKLSQYAGSPHQSEALFMTAEMSYKIRKFEDAIIYYKEYLAKYPEGKHIQRAYFGIGDSHSQLQQNDHADRWYSEAQKRWALDSISKDSILNLGYHYFRSRKYSEAARVFFFFINLYPDDELGKDVLFSIARSLMEINQPAIALKMFSHLIERFPDSREAQESAVIMANIGVRSPGIKLPDLPGIQNYRDPIKVYNTVLVQSGMGEMTEGLLFQKGYALWKYGRYDEAFESFSAMVHLFPQGKYKEDGIKNLLLNINELVQKYSAQRDYLAIARIFFKTPLEILTRDEDKKAVFSIGDALYKTGLLFDAKKILEALLKSTPPGVESGRVLLVLADIENKRGRYDEAEQMLLDIAGKNRPDRKTTAAVQMLRGDIFFRKGLYSKAAAAYADAIASGEELDNEALLYRNYGYSLKETNACSAAIVNYDKAVSLYQKAGQGPPYYSQDVAVTSYQGMGECYLREGKYQEAALMYKKSIMGPAERSENLWALYDMAKGYVNANNPAMAEKTFGDLKSKGGEEFWANIIDYTYREKAWVEKYAKYLP